MELDSKLMFGKYKGKTLRYVMEHDASYIGWAIHVGAIKGVGDSIAQDAKDAYYFDAAEADAWFECFHSDWGDRR